MYSHDSIKSEMHVWIEVDKKKNTQVGLSLFKKKNLSIDYNTFTIR